MAQLALVRIEKEYSPSSCVPSIDSLAEYSIRSRKAEQSLVCQKDLRWGDKPEETLDYFPAASRGARCWFLSWWLLQELSKSCSLFAAPDCVANGIEFAAINYTLAPHTGVEMIVDQCRRAVAWLHVQSDVFGFQRDRLYLSGSSAGAHLVAMMLVKGWQHTAGSRQCDSRCDFAKRNLRLEPLVGTRVATPLNFKPRMPLD